MWEKVKISSVIEKPISGEWGEDNGTTPVIRTTNFTNNGLLNLNNVVLREIPQSKVIKKQLQAGDTIIEKSGGSPTQPVGRVVYFDKEELYLCNNFTSIIRPKADINPKYLFWRLFQGHASKETLKFQNKTTGIINLQLERYINGIQIPLPPLSVQQQIADTLDKADALRRKDKELLKKHDELAQAIFIDMFGDPVKNEKGWEKVKFSELVDKDCPLTYGIVQPGEEFEAGVPCVRPVDLISKFVSVDNLKRIDPKISAKFKRTILDGGELLLSVRGSVGNISIADHSLKGANVTRGIVPIWFNKKTANKLFFYYLYNSESIQGEIKNLTKGATLLQINLSDLRDINVINPPIPLQNEFGSRVWVVEQQKQLAEKANTKSEDLFQGLLQKAFKEENK